MLRIAICDDLETDRAAACRGVELYLSAHPELNGRIDVFSNPSALLDAMESGAAWEIALLDVYMPGISGTQVAQALSAQMKDLPFFDHLHGSCRGSLCPGGSPLSGQALYPGAAQPRLRPGGGSPPETENGRIRASCSTWEMG